MLWMFLGCDPCAGWAGAEVRDPYGLAEDDVLAAMRDTLSAFYADSGATDACVESVIVAELEDPFFVEDGPAPVVAIDADRALSAYTLRQALCTVLDHARGSLGEEGISTCGLGPDHYAWAEEVGAACGITELDPEDAAVRDEVWVNAEFTPTHGVLVLTGGEMISLPDLAIDGGTLAYADTVGVRIGVQSWVDVDEVRQVEVTLVDPWTGAVVATVPVADTGSLHGGAEVLVHDAYVDGGQRALTTIGPDGTATTVTTAEAFYENATAVAGDWLYAGAQPSETARPLRAASLLTGEVRSFDLPAQLGGLLPVVNQLRGFGDDVFVEVLPSEVSVDGDFTSIGYYDRIWYRLDPAAEAWTRLDGPDFYATGVSDGELVGRITSDAGTIYAAWNPDDGALRVSEERCAATLGGWSFVTPGTAWWARYTADDRGLELWPVGLD